MRTLLQGIYKEWIGEVPPRVCFLRISREKDDKNVLTKQQVLRDFVDTCETIKSLKATSPNFVNITKVYGVENAWCNHVMENMGW